MTVAHILIVESNNKYAKRLKADLLEKYGNAYEITIAASNTEGCEYLRAYKESGEKCALVIGDAALVDTPNIVSFVDDVRTLDTPVHVLMTSDLEHREAALEQVFTAKADDAIIADRPLELAFEPVVSKLLAEWQHFIEPAAQRAIVVGPRYSKSVHDLKEYLTMSGIPFTWIDSKSENAIPYVEQLKGTSGPLLITPHGNTILKPTIRQASFALDITQPPRRPIYDVVIVGGGPAGLSEAVQAASEGRTALVLEKETPGGQAGHSSRIENFPGFDEGISGKELAARIHKQALRLGAEVISPVTVEKMEDCIVGHKLTLQDGRALFARSVVLANGVQYRKLQAPGAEELIGSGVYYGASTAETKYFSKEHVVIIGGANSAGQAAVDMSRVAAQVDIVIRGESLDASMSHYLIEQIEARPNITVIPNSEVAQVRGGAHIDGVLLHNRLLNEDSYVLTSGVFVFIGAEPRTTWLKDSVLLDSQGFVLTGQQLEQTQKDGTSWLGDDGPYISATSRPGVFAIGDIQSGSIKRVASAVGQASQTTPSIHKYLDSHEAQLSRNATAPPLVAHIDLPVGTISEARSLIIDTFQAKGYALTPNGAPFNATEYTMEQPAMSADRSEIAKLSLSSKTASTTLLTLSVEQASLGVDNAACSEIVNTWATNLDRYIHENHAALQSPDKHVVEMQTKAASTPQQSREPRRQVHETSARSSKRSSTLTQTKEPDAVIE